MIFRCRLDLFSEVDKVVSAKKEVIQERTTKERKDNKGGTTQEESFPPKYQQESDKGNHKNELPPASVDDVSKDESSKKASNELFKSIFLDSDDSEDSDISEVAEKEENLEEKDRSNQMGAGKESCDSQSKQSTNDNHLAKDGENEASSAKSKLQKEATGLFANIDFASFKKRKLEKAAEIEDEKPVIIGPRKRPLAMDFMKSNTKLSGDSDKSEEDLNEFGPAKPKILIAASSDIKTHIEQIVTDSDNEDEWSEQPTVTKKKHKRSKSKVKKKKDKKLKHKKEKKRKHHKSERKNYRKSKHSKEKAKKRKKERRYDSSSESDSSKSSTSNCTSSSDWSS